jgi:hypothetical protein
LANLYTSVGLVSYNVLLNITVDVWLTNICTMIGDLNLQVSDLKYLHCYLIMIIWASILIQYMLTLSLRLLYIVSGKKVYSCRTLAVYSE